MTIGSGYVADYLHNGAKQWFCLVLLCMKDGEDLIKKNQEHPELR